MLTRVCEFSMDCKCTTVIITSLRHHRFADYTVYVLEMVQYLGLGEHGHIRHCAQCTLSIEPSYKTGYWLS